MRNLYETITNHILAQVDEAGNWKPCWQGAGLGRPHNATSGHRYRGVNILTCWVSQMVHDYPTQEWASFKQWKAAGASVRKGQKGTPIVFYKMLPPKPDDLEQRERPMARMSYVFNRAQVDGLPELEKEEPLTEGERVRQIDEWIGAVCQGIEIRHDNSGSAHFDMTNDRIVMPHFERFHSGPAYYSVLFHELTHWTGHKSRLARPIDFAKRDSIAREELVAEMGAAFIGADFGIEAERRADHVAYIANWLKALKNDKKLVVAAASQAQAAADFLHARQDSRAHTGKEAA